MSDEPTPLRLKPRLKPPDPPAGGSVAPVPPPPETPAGGGEAPKIRLRPKLSAPVEPPPEPEPAPAAEELPAEEQPVAEAPVDEAPVYDTPAEEAPLEETPPPPPDPTAGGAFPKFKLKFKPAASAGAAPEAPPPEEIPAEAPPGDEANPELGSTAEGEPEAAPEEGAPPKPRVIQLRLSEDQLPPLDPGEVKVPKAPVPKKAIIMGSVAVVLVVAIIFGGKMYLNSRVPEPPPPPPKPVIVAAPKPVEPLPDENEAPKPAPAPTVKKAPPPKVAIAPAAATTNLGGGMSATTTDDVVATDASPAFRSWVASAKIGGVFQGSSPRVLINGRTVRVGTVVDDGLGIIFDSVDAENKMIMFKDATGAIVSRHY